MKQFFISVFNEKLYFAILLLYLLILLLILL